MKPIRIIGLDDGDPHIGYNKIYLQIKETHVYGTVRYTDISLEGFLDTMDIVIKRMRKEEVTENILNDEPDINPVVKTGTIQFCTSCNNVVHPDPYNNNYLICSCSLIGQVDPHDRDNVPSWHPASVEIRMKKEEI